MPKHLLTFLTWTVLTSLFLRFTSVASRSHNRIGMLHGLTKKGVSTSISFVALASHQSSAQYLPRRAKILGLDFGRNLMRQEKAEHRRSTAKINDFENRDLTRAA